MEWKEHHGQFENIGKVWNGKEIVGEWNELILLCICLTFLLSVCVCIHIMYTYIEIREI
jgi:hypothetical protein